MFRMVMFGYIVDRYYLIFYLKKRYKKILEIPKGTRNRISKNRQYIMVNR